MSFSARLALFALSALLLPAQERSALEREPQGWTEITPGANAGEYKYRPVEKGHPGPEAEGFRLEFRNLKVKPLPSASLQ